MLRLRHPAQFVVAAFAIVIVAGALLLSLPFATEAGVSPPIVTSIFTSTSAVCVTGLIVVDTPSYWSPFGEGVILLLIQIGGFGIMALASLLALFVYRKLGMWVKIVAQAETKALDLNEVKRVLRGIALFSLFFESITAAVLTIRFTVTYGESFARSLYLGVFHSVSAFNNAGFALYENGLETFVSDWWVVTMIGVTIVIGGIGFPVLLELKRIGVHVTRWSLHTKITLLMTAGLIAAGSALFMLFEWSNPETIGDLSTPSKALSGLFQGITPRTAGFNVVDVGELRETSLLTTMMLMFIGGGSAGTAGGVKVTTVAVLAMMVWAEARGEQNVSLMRRRIPGPAQRQALSIVVLWMFVAIVGTLVLMAIGGFGLERTVFESFSALGTVGLSTGITPEFSDAGRLILVMLMFVGRLGPMTIGAALALREHRRLFRYPEERPIVG